MSQQYSGGIDPAILAAMEGSTVGSTTSQSRSATGQTSYSGLGASPLASSGDAYGSVPVVVPVVPVMKAYSPTDAFEPTRAHTSAPDYSSLSNADYRSTTSGSSFGDSANYASDRVSSGTNHAATSASAGVSRAADSTSRGANAAADSVNRTANSAADSANRGISQAADGVNSAANSASNTANNAANSVNRGLNNASNAANNAANNASNAASNAYNTAYSNTADAANNVSNAASNAANNAADTLNNAANTTANKVNAAAETIKANTPTATGIRQRVNHLGSQTQAQLEQIQQHPAVQDVKASAQKQVGQFREVLGRNEVVREAEKRTGVDRVALVVGGVILYILLIPLNLFGLAWPVTTLLTLLPPTYLAAQILDSPESHASDESTKSLLSYFVVLGFIQFLESLAAGVLAKRIPQYYTLKLVFLAYLLHPRTKGALQIHQQVLRPAFTRGAVASNVNTPPTSHTEVSGSSSPSVRLPSGSGTGVGMDVPKSGPFTAGGPFGGTDSGAGAGVEGNIVVQIPLSAINQAQAQAGL